MKEQMRKRQTWEKNCGRKKFNEKHVIILHDDFKERNV